MITKYELPRLITIGPSGIGYCVEVTQMPGRNDGVFAERIATIPVWDCLAVAFDTKDIADVTLLTNHIGEVGDSEYLRRQLREGVRLVELGERRMRCPQDLVLIERGHASRRWISSLYGPEPEAVLNALSAELKRMTVSSRRCILYLEAAYPPLRGEIFLRRFADIARSVDAALINFGDTAAWRDIETMRPWRYSTPNTFMQWSILGRIRNKDLRSMAHRTLSAELAKAGCIAIMTNGSEDGAIVDGNGLARIHVSTVKNPFTAGAGGKLSSTLIRCLINDARQEPRILAERSFDAATQYVRDMTVRLRSTL